LNLVRLTASPTATSSAVIADENDLCDRLVESRPGDVITYHVGVLARDRAPETQMLPPERCRELGTLANRVLELAEAGWVHLLQRRLGEECFAYLLVVRPRPRSGRRAGLVPPVFLPREVAA
jgi:hypothetical protein